MKRTIVAAICAATIMSGSQAIAATTLPFDSVGDTYTMNFNGMENGVIPGLTAQLTYTLAGKTATDYIFDYTVRNTSSAPVTASRISTFGFNTTPNFLTASIVSGSVFDDVSSGNVPGGLPNVTFCATAGPNCSGGGGGGVFFGGSTSGRFKLSFASAPSAVTFLDNYVRYQAITAPSIRGGSAVGIITSSEVPAGVPEPASWAMMLAGFSMVGYGMRRRKPTQVSA